MYINKDILGQECVFKMCRKYGFYLEKIGFSIYENENYLGLRGLRR